MCHVRSVDDPHQVELEMAGTKTFQQTIATTEHDRHEADDELVKQACVDGLLDDACPMSCTFLPSATARASSIAASTPSVTNVYDGSPAGTTPGSRRVRMNKGSPGIAPGPLQARTATARDSVAETSLDWPPKLPTSAHRP